MLMPEAERAAVGEAKLVAEDGHGFKERRRLLSGKDGCAARDLLSSGCFAGTHGLSH
jgi:hypothetical protein